MTKKELIIALQGFADDDDVVVVSDEKGTRYSTEEVGIINNAAAIFFDGVPFSDLAGLSETNGEETNPVERRVKCPRLSDEGVTDWCLADAGRESLREHMSLLKAAYAEIERLTNLQLQE